MVSALGRITLTGARRFQTHRSIQSLGITSAGKRGFKTNPYAEVSETGTAVSPQIHSAGKQSDDSGSIFSYLGEDDGRRLCSLYSLQQEGGVGRPFLQKEAYEQPRSMHLEVYVTVQSGEVSQKASPTLNRVFPKEPHVMIV